jgi:hypothetical protein
MRHRNGLLLESVFSGNAGVEFRRVFAKGGGHLQGIVSKR